jgi:hypothetical protein
MQTPISRPWHGRHISGRIEKNLSYATTPDAGPVAER